MILIDSKQIFYSVYHQLNSRFPGMPIDSDAMRPMVIEILQAFKKAHQGDFGDLVIAVDSKGTPWRTEINPYYRNRRRSNLRKDLNTNVVSASYRQIVAEFDKFLPVPVINIPTAEADDIIAVLATEFSFEPNLIISSDHDFEQLLHIDGLSLFKPKRYSAEDVYHGVMYNAPRKYKSNQMSYETVTKAQAEIIRLTHVIKGDSGDDVCNILSPPDSLATGTRQKTISAKKLAALMEECVEGFSDHSIQERFDSNLVMVDMTKIPENIKNAILHEYNNQINKTAVGFGKYVEQYKMYQFKD